MPDAASIRRVAVLSLAILFVRVASAIFVFEPGYTDSYYFANVATRLADGQGLTADFIWSPIEADAFALPVASHLFWVPLPTVLAAIGVALFGPLVGDFRAAQLLLVACAFFVPAATYLAARSLGCAERMALAAGAAAGLGGLFAPGYVAVDAFAPAALIGTLFFVAFSRAWAGSVRAGAVAGLLVGLLYLSRSEGAFFGLALVALALAGRSRRAGVAGSLVALAIGGTWLLRDLSVGAGAGVLARSALLARYEDFFALQPHYLAADAGTFGVAIAARGAALVANAITFLFAFSLVLVVPLAAGVRAHRHRADVRAWVGLALLVYAAQCLVFTLHSTRGSYFHSLAAFFPFGLAIAAAGAERLLASRPREVAAGWTWGSVVLVAVISGTAVTQWDVSFNAAARTRMSALDAIPSGTFLAIDAAAWRWLSGRSVLVTPSDGLEAAACFVSLSHATSIVLEEAHFRAYDELYRGGAQPEWLGPPIERGPVKIFPVTSGPVGGCAMAP